MPYKAEGFSKSVIPAEVGVLFLKKPTNLNFFLMIPNETRHHGKTPHKVPILGLHPE
jgi:hypothetical protein